ncbi:hypothetical protein PG985_001805 [Apiospora marii]|uniref:Ankyrin n=1 Tax=Apiospora marii TaxID=335849 RepID=A0ABR1RZK9_9PEZI
MTSIQSLPPELIHLILVHAIYVRGVARGLRLRLVCKLFSIAVGPALLETQLLDGVEDPNAIPTRWPICNYHGADKLWHDHFVLQVRRATQARGQNCYRAVHNTVRSYCSETGADFVETTDAVCWLGLYRAQKLPVPAHYWNSRLWDKTPPWEREEGGHISQPYCCHPRLDFLCVSAYLGHEPLVRRLLDEGVPSFCHSHMFASPMQLAALAGHGAILRLLQERVPDLETLNAAKIYSKNWAWKGREVPSAVWGAVNSGRVDMLELAVHNIPSDSRDAASASHFARTVANGGTFGHVPWSTVDVKDTLDAGWTYAQAYAPNPGILGCLFARVGEVTPKTCTALLSTYSRYGNVEIVRYLLDRGAAVNPDFPGVPYPLCQACRHGHEAIVDILLEAGADTNLVSPYRKTKKHEWKSTTPLAQAAAGGSLVLVRKLLAWGARATDDDRPVWNALRLEHREMLELLLSLNPPLTPLVKLMMQKKLSEEGLEPMLKLEMDVPDDCEDAD